MSTGRAGRRSLASRIRLLAVLAAACWLLLPAASASAHAVLVSTTPSAGTTVQVDPPVKEVVLTFTEPVRIRFGGIRVLDSSLERFDVGEPRLVGDRTVAVDVKPLTDGSYIVAWRVISADTHPIRGAFTFAVGTGTVPRGGEVDAALDEFGSAPGPVLVAAAASRTLAYATALLLFAPLVFLLLVWRPGEAGGAADRRMVRAVARLVRLAWPAAVVANLLFLVTEAAIEAGVPLAKAVLPSTLGPVLSSTLGNVWIGRMVVLAALLPLLLRLGRPSEAPSGAGPDLVSARARQPARSVGAMAATSSPVGHAAPAGRKALTWAAAVLAAAVVVAPSLWGHATTTSPKALAVASDAVHLLSMSAWVGGLLCLLLLVPRVLRDAAPTERSSALARTVPRFSALALGSVGLIVVTGTFLAVKHVDSWKALFDSSYGLVVVAKVVGLALALVLAAFNLFRTQRRLRAAEDRPEDSDLWARRLRRAVAGEAIVTTVVIALASVLVSLSPPRTAGAAGGVPAVFSAERVPMGPGRADVQVFPLQAGQPVQVHATFVTPAGAPDDAIAEVTVSLTQVEQDLGPFEHQAIKLAPGHYVASGFSLPAPGTWRMQVQARRGEFDEYSHTFEFPVG